MKTPMSVCFGSDCPQLCNVVAPKGPEGSQGPAGPMGPQGDNAIPSPYLYNHDNSSILTVTLGPEGDMNVDVTKESIYFSVGDGEYPIRELTLGLLDINNFFMSIIILGGPNESVDIKIDASGIYRTLNYDATDIVVLPLMKGVPTSINDGNDSYSTLALDSDPRLTFEGDKGTVLLITLIPTYI